MIGRIRAAWDESGRMSNHRRGSNPMTRDEWKSAELRQGDILAHVEVLAKINPELLSAVKRTRDLLDSLSELRNCEREVLDALVLRHGIRVHRESVGLLCCLTCAVETHESSPSADGAGAHSVGDREAAGDETASPAANASPAERNSTGCFDQGDGNTGGKQQGVSLSVGFGDRQQCSLTGLAETLQSIERILRGRLGERVDDPVVLDSVLGLIGHETSPSADVGGAHSVGDGQVAGVETAAPVTDATTGPQKWTAGVILGGHNVAVTLRSTPVAFHDSLVELTAQGVGLVCKATRIEPRLDAVSNVPPEPDDMTRQIGDVLEELHNQGNSWREIASKTRRIFTAPASTS